MPFVKIDTGILRSTLWFDRAQRDVFLTALFMAELYELRQDTPQLGIETPEPTGWLVPAGWYGFVRAAGVGIAHVAQVAWTDAAPALKAMGEPEVDSRSQEFEGRRLVRVNGGYIVLNYMKYRERDYTAAERQMRYRSRKRSMSSGVIPSHGATALPSRDGVTDDITGVMSNATGAVTVTDSRVQSTEYIQKDVRTLPNGRESSGDDPRLLMDLWNGLTQPPLPRCLALGKSRKVHARARLTERSLDEWRDVIARIQASAFCRGDNDRNWTASFDWLVANDENAAKVLEGKYDDREPRRVGKTAGNLEAARRFLERVPDGS